MVDIILKNANGINQEYYGITKIKVPKTDGNLATFIEESVVSGGGEVNGYIKKFKVQFGERINSGDFVEFVNDIVQTELSTTSGIINNFDNIINLSDNKFFIAYNSGEKLAGLIVELNGDEATITTQILNNNSYSSRNYLPVSALVDDNKIFIAHCYSYDYYIYGTLIEINGTEMNVLETKSLTNSREVDTEMSITVLETNKVFLVRGVGRQVKGQTITTDNSTITVTKSSTILSEDYSGYENKPFVCKLEDEKVLLVNRYHNYHTSKSKQLGIHILDTTTLIVENSTFSEPIPYNIGCLIQLTNNKIFAPYKYDDTGRLKSIIINIDDKNISTKIIDLGQQYCKYSINSGYGPTGIALNKNTISLVYTRMVSETLNSTTIELDDDDNLVLTITTEIDNTSHSAYYRPMVTYFNNKLLYLHVKQAVNNGYYFYATIYKGLNVKPKDININGVAKTSGSNGEEIEVYIPIK